MKGGPSTSGFTRADFVLTFTIADLARRADFAALCASEWGGTEITDTTWELATALAPAELEQAISRHLAHGDRAAFYYLTSPGPDAKRLFRVVTEG